MNTIENELADWLDRQVSYLPKAVKMIYLEYVASNARFTCVLFGYTSDELAQFDPEDTVHLDSLSTWQWESDMFEFLMKGDGSGPASQVYDPLEMVEKAISASKEVPKLAEQDNVMVIYGLHEGSPKLFRQRARPDEKRLDQEAGKIHYYELHFDYSGSHRIDGYDLQGIDERQLLLSNKIDPYPIDYSILLDLQEGTKLKDLLWFYRGWLVCSQKLVDIFKKYTSNLQVFPCVLRKHLDGELELVEGYHVVNLYEKIDCIDAKWLLVSSPRTGEVTFDPGKGYKVLREKVVGKDIFRINVRDSRLLVSQRFRDEIESRKISGISWLKREAE